jgi:hypothetical protein
MNRILSRVAIASLALLGWFLSGAIHELGHAGVAKLAGLEVIDIQPWALRGRVHVQFAGGTTKQEDRCLSPVHLLNDFKRDYGGKIGLETVGALSL